MQLFNTACLKVHRKVRTPTDHGHANKSLTLESEDHSGSTKSRFDESRRMLYNKHS